MRPQINRPAPKPRTPVHLLSDPLFSGLLERDFDDVHEFDYEHGLLDNVDRLQSHHTPWDFENDAQDFYNRQITEDFPEED